MANTFLTAKSISGLAVALLNRALVLPNTVSKIPGSEYAGPNGGTVTVMAPTPLVAREQVTPGTQITWDDVAETAVDVVIKHFYSGVKVTDEELTMKLVDFGRQVTMNQVQAVALKAEGNLAAVMNGIAVDASFAATASDADTKAMILTARAALGGENVPAGDRFFAVSPDIATRVLSVPEFTKVDESGSSSALREASIGRLFGFMFVESNSLTPGTAIAYHRTGFAFANFAPTGVTGADGVDLATYSEGGITMRQAIQWLPDFLSMGSVLQTFAGSNVVDADRVFKMDIGS